MRRLLLASLILLALPALALARTNPADELIHIPIEASVYDAATECDDRPRRGVVKLRRWLEKNVRGVFWGAYRCEKWGKHEASLHAENRAIDWHLDASSSADRRAADDGKRGKPRKHVNVTVAHRDHIHIGMTKAGAAGRTSFWRVHTG